LIDLGYQKYPVGESYSFWNHLVLKHCKEQPQKIHSLIHEPNLRFNPYPVFSDL